ncbi:hypothetical protein DYB32_004452, partial [Aphanomyces invadans]
LSDPAVHTFIKMAQRENVVCVTGGSGFLGSTCIKLLLERGYRVHATVRDPNNAAKVAHLKALSGASDRLTLFGADLLQMWYGLSKTIAEREAWEFVRSLVNPHFDMVTMCPTWILGPMLQPELNESSKKIYDYMVGNTKEIMNTVKAMVDVRDVALAHIVGFENPQASGRYLLIGACPSEQEIANAVKNAYHSALTPEAPVSPSASVSLSECVANVVRMVFPSELDPSTHAWNSILHVLNNHAAELNLLHPLRSDLLDEHYDGTLVSQDMQTPPSNAELELERTLSAVCIGAFKGAQQASFVNDVLSLSENIQLTLFTLLREDDDCEAISGDSIPTHNSTICDDDPQTPSTPVQPTKQASSASATPGSASSCSKNEIKRMARENLMLKEENARLQTELLQAKDAMAELNQTEERRKDDFDNLKLELRVEAAKNERAMKKQVDEYVAHMQDELTKATSKLQSLSNIEVELAAARDELDILKPVADKAARLEARVEKYQAKLDEMTRVKELNRRLEDKTAELLEKTHSQEVQLQKLINVQRKLEETKESMANMVRLKQDMQSAMDQLQDTIARGGSLPAVELLVDGDLRDEVEALRRENTKLKDQLSLETATHVDALGEDLDIMARVKKSFENKYFDSQRVVEQLEAELAATKQHLDASNVQQRAVFINLEAAIAKCDAIQAEFSQEKAAWAIQTKEWRGQEATLQEKLAIEDERNADLTRTIESLKAIEVDLAQTLAEQRAATASVEAARDELNVEMLNVTVNLADTISKLGDQEQHCAKITAELETTKELWMAESNEFAEFKVAAHSDRCQLDEMTAKVGELGREILRLQQELDLTESQRMILEHVRFDNEKYISSLRAHVNDVEESLRTLGEACRMADEESAVLRRVKAEEREEWNAQQIALKKDILSLEAQHAKARLAWLLELEETRNETDVQRRVAQDVHDALDAKVKALEEEAAQATDAHDRHVVELEKTRQALEAQILRFQAREKRGEEILAALKAKYHDDVQAKDDMIQLLDVQTSRLEAKNRMLEKERSHYHSHQDSTKRHMSAEYEAVSLKMEMQLIALKADLPPASMKQKQLVLCTTTQAQEIQKLKDITNRLRLREERRSKAMEKENGAVFASPGVLSPTLKRKLDDSTMERAVAAQSTPGAKRSRTTSSPQSTAATSTTPLSRQSSALLQPSASTDGTPQCSQQ